MEHSTSCSCKNIPIVVSLPRPLEAYRPRACDCDFCVQRNAKYISDPKGTLQIGNQQGLERLTQGSNTASFWQCATCHDLVAVTYESPEGLKGTINANLIADKAQLTNSATVSPKTLSPEQKKERWNAAWMSVSFQE